MKVPVTNVLRAALRPAVAVTALAILGGCGQSPEGGYDPGLTGSEAVAQAGRQKSRSCMGCHGPQGISRVNSYPSLAGRSEEYLQEQLMAYRSGGRSNPMMSSIARNLSDDDIAALSVYYAGLPGPDED